ncbi:MAG: hypothetical protein A2170_16245 [Deltaproteobacteria bacterium RBG_13_53_10]|nr:MAG: hypothetical protein A2170_16245 [Deltaproteobacteria bacterium RBG_13_53_10]
MITPEQQEHIYRCAYVPEHIISLMVLVSKGEPSLIDTFIYYMKDNWLIFVGYPLDQNLSPEKCEPFLKGLLEKFRPEYLWFIGKELPPSLISSCAERQSDHYYKLDLHTATPKKELNRVIQRALQDLTVERSSALSKKHDELINEFIKREKPNPWIKVLFQSMPEYVDHSESAMVLNALDKKGHLSAFYVVDLGAESFATYVVGCHSRKRAVAHASDLLFFEMIRLARESGKTSINLGLGVNPGIRRFKEKWGGIPFLNYEFCEHRTGHTTAVSLIRALEGKL